MQLIDEEFKNDMDMVFSTRFREYWHEIVFLYKGVWVDFETRTLREVIKTEELELCN